MTEIVTGEGKLDLASVHDAFSRRALGYAMGEHRDAELGAGRAEDGAGHPRRPGRAGRGPTPGRGG
ncbi:hypothetical protein [Streptomyces abyssomicinicus]|uniref:hypothetical protein n=1 Tax=Streptomyces abyssomicinicus TaxID=574929 RepID=UPI0013DF9065|nr:hypothetical protein [Streptomyces abyssomicinicus]